MKIKKDQSVIRAFEEYGIHFFNSNRFDDDNFLPLKVLKQNIRFKENINIDTNIKNFSIDLKIFWISFTVW